MRFFKSTSYEAQFVQQLHDAPLSMQRDLAQFALRKKSNLQQLLSNNPDPYMTAEYNASIAAYSALLQLLNTEAHIMKSTPESHLVRYNIADGYLQCPDTFIIVNPDMATQCTQALVVTCQLADYGMPHMIYLTNRTSKDYDDDFIHEVNLCCTMVYPEFPNILKAQVTPIDDPDHPGMMSNWDEWRASPQLGYFQLFVKGETAASADCTPPYNAMLVRNK